MSEKTSTHQFISANVILVIIIALIGAPFLTPWQLFQQLCPYFNSQSPQCAMFQQQLQQQQQQALSSSPYTTGAPSTSAFSSLPGFPSSSSTAPSP
jgi:predicted negative regulator of RcsB-dependent stress response